MTDELLDLSDIANLYRVSRRYARDVSGEVSRVPDAGIGYQPKDTTVAVEVKSEGYVALVA